MCNTHYGILSYSLESNVFVLTIDILYILFTGIYKLVFTYKVLKCAFLLKTRPQNFDLYIKKTLLLYSMLNYTLINNIAFGGLKRIKCTLKLKKR